MIYIDNTNKANLHIPKSLTIGTNTDYELELEHLITKNVYKGVSIGALSINEYVFDCSLCNFTDGQYAYTIKNSNNEILGKGLAQFGNYSKPIQQYQTNNNFIQYEK